jgi:hypothetical protein
VVLFGLWVFLTIRAVHGECVVGDREFWQTRPYTGMQLLAAKALFLFVCLNLPLLITQIFLLVHAGIPLSFSLVPGFLILQLEFALFLTFPVFAIAAVTESLIQWILVVGGLILFFMVMSWLPWNKLPETLSGQEGIGTLVAFVLIVPALMLAIVWQYTRRTVGLARLAIGLACVAVAVAILVAHTKVARSIAYAQLKDVPPFQISVHPQDGSETHEYFRTKGEFGTDTINIPINFGSTDSDLDVDLEGMRILLTGDSGWKWQSPWMNRALSLSPASPDGGFEFQLASDLADQIPRVHAEASVEIAYREHRFGKARRIDTGPHRFSISGVGICNWHKSGADGFSRTGYNCAAPLQLPGMFVGEIESGDSSCPGEEGEPPVPAGHAASSTIYGADDVWIGMDPNPVRQFEFNFGKWSPPIKIDSDPKNDRNATLCRGMPISVRLAEYVGRMQSGFKLGAMGTEKLKTNEEPSVVSFDMKKR